jgi:hypothetical protein
VYEDSLYLKAYDTIRIFSKSYCIGKIYIWNPEVDKRQLFDISGLLDLPNNKVQYVSSPTLQQAIDNIGNLDVVYDWDVDRVYEVVSTGLYNNILFAVGNYPFNFELDDMNKLKYNLNDTDNVRSFIIGGSVDIPYYG